MTQPRCLGHLLGRRRPPVNVVAGLQSDLTNEFALRPAIAFPKRMSRIQLAEKIGRAIGKHRGIQVSEVASFSRICCSAGSRNAAIPKRWLPLDMFTVRNCPAHSYTS